MRTLLEVNDRTVNIVRLQKSHKMYKTRTDIGFVFFFYFFIFLTIRGKKGFRLSWTHVIFVEICGFVILFVILYLSSFFGEMFK